MGRHGPVPDGDAPDARLRRLEGELAAARLEIERLRHFDPLTGALNRAGLARAIEQVEAEPLCAIVLDIDDFDRVNEQLGHAAGDLALRELARRLRDVLGPAPLLARLEGDRFLALLAGVGQAEGRGVAERIRLAIMWAPFAWDPEPLHLTASIGVVELPSVTTSVQEVLSLARVALDRSKRRGKNVVSGSGEASTSTNLVTPALRPFIEAVRAGTGLTMWVQSIQELPSEGTAGWEMLVRGPSGPLARPDDLFGMAEEHRVSTALDLTCLRLAVRAASAMARRGVFHLNVLPTSLLEAPPDQLGELLAAPPDGVTWCVELSEKQFLGDPAELVSAVERLRDAGVLVAVDDVGSGRGTLDSVIALQPHVAKLDIRLVRGISADPWRRGFVSRLVKLAEMLGMEVVAEGIETRDDLDVLLGLGVQMGQGYLWGRPEPATG